MEPHPCPLQRLLPPLHHSILYDICPIMPPIPYGTPQHGAWERVILFELTELRTYFKVLVIAHPYKECSRRTPDLEKMDMQMDGVEITPTGDL